MSAIDFSALPIRRAVPMTVAFGRVQRPGTGGETFRTDRLGNRWAFQFETASMPLEPNGARWQALFDDAERVGGVFSIKQPGFVIGPCGSPTVGDYTPAGRLIPLTGLTPRYSIRARQWLSTKIDGQWFLDRIMEPAMADASGNATVRIKNLIRRPLSEGDMVELAAPKIQGTIEMSGGSGWELERVTSFAFTVTEDA
jgi:hypothetical protein